MEPWPVGGAPWCIGSVFPAPQLLTGPAAIPLGPLMFDGIGMPQRLLSTGCPLPLFESFIPSVSEQKEEFLPFSGDTYVPEDLLKEHLQEDTVLREAFSAHSSQILGNRLQIVECRDGDYAFFFPSGNNVDRIGGALCSRDIVKNWQVSTSDACHHSLQNTSIPLRQPIFQLSAVRKDSWDPDSGFLVAARSLYMVQFLQANQELFNIRVNPSGFVLALRYPSEVLPRQDVAFCLTVTLVRSMHGLEIEFALPKAASFGKYVSHVAWNQHIQGESAVVLESGEVLLFDLQRGWSTNNLNAKASYIIPRPVDSSTSFSAPTRQISKPRSKIAMQKKRMKPLPVSNPFEWWQCEYAWHPKTLLLAGSREVSLLDFRVKNGSVADQLGGLSASKEHRVQNFNTLVVARIPGLGRAGGYLNRASASDVVLSFARAAQDGSYEFCISTKKHVILFDSRQPQTPLLQWLHGMEAEPPSVLSMCPIPSTSQEDSVTPSDRGKIILAASFHSGNIQAFCYGPHPTLSSPPPCGLISSTMSSHLDDRIYAWGLPSKVVAPQGSRTSWASILDSSMKFFQQDVSKAFPSKRMWDRLSGLVLLPQSCENTCRVVTEDLLRNCREFSLMQLTGEGDILAQQFESADRLRSTGSHLSPMRSSDADPTNIRNGSGLPGSDDSKPFKNNHEPDDAMMDSGLASEDQCAIVPWSPLNERLSKAGKEGLKGDSFLLELHEDSNREKVIALVAEALQQMNVPLSIYEIAHVVLRRYLPAGLEKLAAGMPADVRLHHLRKYLSMILASQPPEGSLIESNGLEEDVGSSMEGWTVPLPVLLEEFSSERRSRTWGNQLANFGMEDTQLSVVAQESSSSRRSVLQEGCDHVRLAVRSLTTEMKCREPVLDLSLADSVEAWNNISVGTGGSGTSRLVQFQTSDRELVLPSLHGKPIRGQALNMATPMAVDRVNDDLGGNFSQAERRLTSVLDKDVLGDFFGTFADGYHGTSAVKVLKDSHLCPIQLPFLASSETEQPVTATGLSDLRDQFKQWQESFVPYQIFCRTRLPSQ